MRAFAPVWIVSTVLFTLLAPVAPAMAEVSPPPATADRMLVIGTKEAPPFAMKAADGSWSGISIELWRRVANELHLRYRFEETTLQGLIDNTASGSLDAAVAALTVTAERERVVDFTQPFYATGLGIAVPNHAAFAWWQLLRSFLSVAFVGTLIGLIGVTFLVGTIIWLLERRRTEHFRGGLKTGLMTGIWWSAMTMAQAGSEKGPQTGLGRAVAISWMTMSVIVISTFTAGITSQLTTRELQGVVHGFSDLHTVRVGTVNATAGLEYLTRQRIEYRSFATPREGMNALKAGTLDAFVYDRPLLAWMAKEDFGGYVDVLGLTFDRQNYAIALPVNSILRGSINQVTVEAIRTEWWQDLITKYIGKD